MEKIKLGLIGLGAMGKGHFNTYVQLMNEGFPIELVAICDINKKQFANTKGNLNIEEVRDGDFNFEKFHQYTKFEEMIEKEDLDMVSVVIPTYEHFDATVYALSHGLNVLCEKPMALTEEQCRIMIETAKKNGKKLMIGQCLRFWGEYVEAKKLIDSKELGDVLGARFYRGGARPETEWFFEREKGGGSLFDQHIHDVDMVQNLFGMPIAVSSVGSIVVPGSGYDIVATNYLFDNGIAVTTQDDWCNCETTFKMEFRINLTKGTIVFDSKGFRVFNEKMENVTPEFTSGLGYYNEVKYFVNTIINNTENTVNPPEASMNTIRIALAETLSCDLKGQIIEL